jgi:uncharacterized membrane protein YbhN (UPF0104 family)
VHELGALLDRLAGVSWPALVLALVLYLGRIACATRAWRNIISAAYPDEQVPWRGIFGAATAGMAVSSFVPAKAGELVRLYLARRSVPAARYPTLAGTLLVESIFPFCAAAGFLVAAVHFGAVPGLRFVPSVPAASIATNHPFLTAGAGLLLIGAVAVLAVRLGDHLSGIWARFAQGFAIVGNWRGYLRRVLLWQALDWTFRLLALYWFLRAFGLAPSLHNAFSVQVAQNVSALVPLTPSGIGTEQALIVSNLAGTPTADALGFSVGMKLALVSVNVVVGFTALLLMARTLRWRSLLVREGALLGRRSG